MQWQVFFGGGGLVCDTGTVLTMGMIVAIYSQVFHVIDRCLWSGKICCLAEGVNHL